MIANKTVPPFRPLLLVIAAALLLGLSALPARAQTQYYDYSGSVGTYPFDFFPIDPFVDFYDMSGNTLFVGTSALGSFSMLAGARLRVDDIAVGNGGTGSGSVSVSGASTRLELGGMRNRLEIGNWGTGSMVVSSGALLDATFDAAACFAPGAACWNVIGNAAGSTGTLTVTGGGSEVRALRQFAVGSAWVSSGFGTPGGTTNAFLNVLDGGTLRTETALVGIGPSGPSALGTEHVVANVTIDGAGSRWFVTSNSIDGGGANLLAASHANARAMITITNGAQIIVDGSAGPGPYDSFELGSNGGRADLTVSGGGKLLLNGGAAMDRYTELKVGGYRSGSSQATVTGAGSEIVVTGAHATVTVGDTGATGQLDVLSGGRVASGGLYIAGRESTGTVNVNGGTIDLNGRDGRVLVGISGAGALVVSGGGVVDATLDPAVCAGSWCGSTVANGAGSTGTLTITGAGSEVRTLRYFSAGSAYVDEYTGTAGRDSYATINILDGGTLRTEGASVSTGPGGPDALATERTFANVVIDGAGSRWIVTRNSVDNDIAFLGAGTHANAQATITITNGGKLIVDGTGSIGPFDGLQLATNGGRADLTVSGVGSAVDIKAANPFINVGRSGATGQGSFSVLAGATASAMFLNVGRDGAHGDLKIDGAGSQVTLSGVGTPGVAGTAGASIGRDGGTGAATVSNGGRWLITDGGADSRPNVSSPNLVVGQGAAGTGSLNITGAGSTVEIVSTSLGLAPGVADNYNPYMRVGRDAGSTGDLLVSDGGRLLLTGNAKTSLTDQRYTSLVIGGRDPSVAGGVGHATITGLGSEVRLAGTDAYVSVGRGPGGQGRLDVLNLGRLDSTGLDVGWTGGKGTMTIDNATVRLSGGPFVDGAGAGMTIGAGSGSVGTVSMNHGARISLSSDTASFGINVGGGRTLDAGTGTLAMAGGSVIEYSGTASHALSIGRSAGSTGTVTMAEGSSVALGSNGFAFVGRVVGSTGTLYMRGGSALSADYVGIGSTPGVDTGIGTLIVSDNSTVTATTVEIGARGLLGGSGGTINADVIIGGTLSPGESPGKIRINGGITPRGGGTLVLDVAATEGGNFAAVARGFISPLGELTPGYDIDQLVIGSGSTFDFAGLNIVMNFVGTTDPTAFADSGGLDLDNFMRSASGSTETGLSTVFAPGEHWTDVLAEATVVARSEVADYDGMVLEFTGSSAGITAVVTNVPEPSTWASMLVGLWSLTAVARHRQRVARRL